MRLRSPLTRSLVAASWMFGCTSLLGIDGDYSMAPVEENPDGSGGTAVVPDSGNGGTSKGGSGGVSTSGAGPAGGSATGGGPASGGVHASGGANTGGNVNPGGAGSECDVGKKLCPLNGDPNGELKCVVPDPAVGCDLTGCTQCAPPSGGYGLCEGTTCSFGCFDGFVRKGNACEAVALPDSGSPSTGGRPSTCTKPEDCPACGPTPGCCTLIPKGKCGCNFVWCVPPPP